MICSELFIVSIHEGIASTSPALAALWGSLEADLSGAVCGGGGNESDFHRIRERHDRSDRTGSEEDGGSNRKSSSAVRQSLPAGNETFAFAEYFYIRLRGLLRSSDSFTFSYGLDDRIATKKNSGEIL